MGGFILHHDKRRHKQCRFVFFFIFRKKHFPDFFSLQLLGIIGLHVQDELQPTSSSRLARLKMVLVLVGWSQGAHNEEIRENNLVLKIVTFVTKNIAGEKLRSPN